MVSIAFAAMKFFVDRRPINGRSVAFGTGGFVVTRARRSNESLTVADRGGKKDFGNGESLFFEADDDESTENFRAGGGVGSGSATARVDEVPRATRRAESATTTALGGRDENRARFARRDAFVVGREGNAIEPECGGAGFGTSRVVFRRGTELVRDTEGVRSRETLGR